MKTRNIKAFKALIIRYETITLKEIENAHRDNSKLTGFGRADTCALCITLDGKPGGAGDNCAACVWYKTTTTGSYGCFHDKNKATFLNIRHAYFSEELLKAYRARAAHMRSVLKKLRIKQP